MLVDVVADFWRKMEMIVGTRTIIFFWRGDVQGSRVCALLLAFGTFTVFACTTCDGVCALGLV